MTRNVLITTRYLEQDDEVHRALEAAGCEVMYSRPQDRQGDPAALAQAVSRADAVISGTEPLTAEMIFASDSLRIIARTGVGYDNIDVNAARSRGVVVCNTPGANATSVTELALGLMLNCARFISDGAAEVRAGEWHQRSGRELSGSTLGLIGLGGIGRQVALLGLAFGMRVLAFDTSFDERFLAEHPVERASLSELLAESDFVSVHTALTHQTRNLLDAEALAAMKPTACVINTARGGIVDEHALAQALHEGRIGAAGLDVLMIEPPEPDHPLLSAPRCVLTPHIAGATEQARARSGARAAAQVISFFDGQQIAHEVTA